MPRMAVHGLFVAGICNGCNSQGAVDAADNTANHATNQTAKRSGCLHAHMGAMSDAVRDALCLRRKRESK